MDALITQYKKGKDFHHAILFTGEKENLINLIKLSEIILGRRPLGDPDFTLEERDNFSVDDARELRRVQATKSIGGRRVFVLSFNTATVEAQNTLLKTFEEPTENTYFIVLVPSREVLLTTLKSRMEEITINKKKKQSTNSSNFLSQSFKERELTIRSIINDKNRSHANLLLNEIEEDLSSNINEKSDRKIIVALEEIQKARKHLTLDGCNLKFILEHIALIVPIRK